MDEIGYGFLTVSELVDLCCKLADYLPIDVYRKCIREVVKSEIFKETRESENCYVNRSIGDGIE